MKVTMGSWTGFDSSPLVSFWRVRKVDSFIICRQQILPLSLNRWSVEADMRRRCWEKDTGIFRFISIHYMAGGKVERGGAFRLALVSVPFNISEHEISTLKNWFFSSEIRSSAFRHGSIHLSSLPVWRGEKCEKGRGKLISIIMNWQQKRIIKV